MQILLIRHCQAVSQAPGAPLTADGTKAAERLATFLRSCGVDALFSSPYKRALETLAPFSTGDKVAIRIDDRLAERRLESQSSPDWLEHVRRSFDDLDYRAPSGETLREAQQRGLGAIQEISRASHKLPAVATHGNLLAALLHSADHSFGFERWRELKNPDIFRVTVEKDQLLAFVRITPT